MFGVISRPFRALLRPGMRFHFSSTTDSHDSHHDHHDHHNVKLDRETNWATYNKVHSTYIQVKQIRLNLWLLGYASSVIGSYRSVCSYA
jgi:hypothetical protein